MQDASTRHSTLRYIGKERKGRVPAQEAANCVLTASAAYFGAPRVIMSDPDARFVGGVFRDFCESRHISFMETPAKFHTGIGSLGRKHAAIDARSHRKP